MPHASEKRISRHTALRSALAAASVLIVPAALAEDDDAWRWSVGPGAVAAWEYPGADDVEVLPIPALDVAYGRSFFLHWRRGLGGYLLNDGDRQFGASVWWRRGRDHRDGERIAALHDVEDSAVAQLLFNQNIGPLALSATVAQAIAENTGLTLEGSAAWRFQLAPTTRASLGVQGMLGNDRYMRTYFGISPEAARLSGLPEHSIDAGLRTVGAFALISHDLTPRWTLAAFASYDLLIGDAADSPVVEREQMPALALGLFHHFDR
jgi:outer membrane protein